jgi:cytoskeletal protein CcmA (bactofilin family)
LDELKLYVDGSFAGDGLEIARLYNGEWFDVVSLNSNNEVNKYLSNGILTFDIKGEKANKIRVSFGGNVQITEITLSGSLVAGEKVKVENVFSGKEFEPSLNASGNMYSAAYGYQTITDGIIYQ